MERIESPDGLFHEGNPATGEKGTKVTAIWLNSLQEEVIALGGNIRVIAVDTTLTESDRVVFIDTTSAPVAVHLPVYETVPSKKEFKLKVIAGDNPATIDAVDAKTIDNQFSIELVVGDRTSIVKDSANWQTI